MLYTIPSLALFALLSRSPGSKRDDRLIGLVLYALLVLVRNTLAGLRRRARRRARRRPRHGLRPGRMLWRVELPLALPAIMAGVRVATVSTVALVTVGGIVGDGGLGS